MKAHVDEGGRVINVAEFAINREEIETADFVTLCAQASSYNDNTQCTRQTIRHLSLWFVEIADNFHAQD